MAGCVLLALYLATATYSEPYGSDAFTNAVQARAFADDQSPILEEFEGFQTPRFQGSVGWFADSPDGVTSQYPPGAAVWATPFYLFDTSLEVRTLNNADAVAADGGEVETIDLPTPSFVPASIAAALSVAIAMVFLGFTLTNFMSRRAVLGSLVAAGLGTGAWSVAADKLWQHGPAMMCISVGTYLASVERYAASGLVFGAAVLVRPHTAVIVACIGLAIAISRRSLREVATLGAFSFVGLAALVVYNRTVFGGSSVSGGYGGSFSERLVNDSPLILIGRLLGMFVHLDVGIFWSSPFLILGLYALWKERSTAPDWAIGASIGGLVYLVIQFRANRLTGGWGFYGYRYPLEALMASAPMIAITASEWLSDESRRQKIFAVLVVLSILSHGAGSLES